MLDNLSISHKGAIVVLGLLLMEFSIVGALVAEFNALSHSLAAERHVLEVLDHANSYLYWTQRYSIDFSMAVFATPNSTPHKDESYNRSIPNMYRELQALEQSVSKDQTARQQIRTARELQLRSRSISEALRANKKQPLPLDYQNVLDLMHESLSSIHALQARYQRVQFSGPEKTSESLDKINHRLMIGFAVNLLASLGAAIFYFKRVAGRINSIADNVNRFADRQPLVSTKMSNDEIGRIDKIFHRMALELETAAKIERSLFLNSTDVMCSIDTRSNFLEVNPATLGQWGFEAKELIGRDVGEILKAPILTETFLDIDRFLSGDADCAVEAAITRKDGTEISTLWAINWSSNDGSYFCFVRDCTEDKRIEQLIAKQEREVRYAIENMPVGIVTTDEAWRIQSLNKRAEAMLARTGNDLTQISINELLKVSEHDGTKAGDTEVPGSKSDIRRNGIGNSTTDGGSSKPGGSRYSTTDDADTESDTVYSTNGGDKATGTQTTSESPLLTSMLSSDSTPMPIQCVSENSEGQRWYADVSVSRSVNADNTGHVLLIDDVSERVLLAELKEKFVTVLGENLHSPLGIVRGIIFDELQKSGEEGKLGLRLNRAIQNLDRLLKMIDELLNIQKLGTGRLIGEKVPTPVDELVRAAVEAVRDHAEQQNIQLDWQPAKGLVAVDGQRIVQVLINLLTNAIKYSNSGTTITVKVDSNSDTVYIGITDQGRGVPAHMREAIFAPFVQTSTDDARRGAGTGLGLAICKQIIEHHDGKIGVDSEDGKGSTFWIRLPGEQESGK